MKKNIFSVFTSIVILTVIFVMAFSSEAAYAVGPPEPITDLIAVPANNAVHLIWTSPYHNGEPIQNYKVIMWKTGSDATTTFPNISTTKAIITELTNGASYNFKVLAKNSRGESADSNIVSAKPTSSNTIFPPDNISDLKATRGDGKISLGWTAPYNGGTQITGYKVYYWQLNSGDIKTKTLTGSANSAQITGLTNDVSYRVKVVALNSMGHGPDSNIVSATPSTSSVAQKPNEVRGVNAVGFDGQVLVTWVKPSENGSPINNYKVIVAESGSIAFTTYPTKSTDTQATITGLKNGVKYTFKVIAINAIGESRISGSVSATPEKKVSIAVTNLKAASGDGKVNLSWSLTSDKLEDVSGYRIREYSGGSNSFVVHDILGKTTKATITGLTNGVSYGFSIVVVTNQGPGPSSNIVNVIPKAVQIPSGAPSAISDLKVTADKNQVKLSWSTPSDNGNKITGYHIQQFKKGESIFVTIPQLDATPSAVISGLTNGITYDFKVIPINSSGAGPVSNTVSATPGSFEPISVPEWVKTTALWWAQGKISTLEYTQSIEWLANQGIIKLK